MTSSYLSSLQMNFKSSFLNNPSSQHAKKKKSHAVCSWEALCHLVLTYSAWGSLEIRILTGKRRRPSQARDTETGVH